MDTEPTMRTRSISSNWCFIVGRGMYDHCLEKLEESSCPADTSSNICQDYWKYFGEACFRVHSLDPNDNSRKVRYRNPNYPCIAVNPNYSLYEMHRV